MYRYIDRVFLNKFDLLFGCSYVYLLSRNWRHGRKRLSFCWLHSSTGQLFPHPATERSPRVDRGICVYSHNSTTVATKVWRNGMGLQHVWFSIEAANQEDIRLTGVNCREVSPSKLPHPWKETFPSDRRENAISAYQFLAKFVWFDQTFGSVHDVICREHIVPLVLIT